MTNNKFKWNGSKLTKVNCKLSRKLISEVTVGQNAVQEYQQNVHVILTEVRTFFKATVFLVKKTKPKIMVPWTFRPVFFKNAGRNPFSAFLSSLMQTFNPWIFPMFGRVKSPLVDGMIVKIFKSAGLNPFSAF